VATVLIGTWVKEIDRDQAMAVLRGERPFDEARMIDDDPAEQSVVESEVVPAATAEPAPAGVREEAYESVHQGASR
jgi:aerobic C4-dicarboxylate transport protein